MPYSLGNLARKMGSIRSYSAAAWLDANRCASRWAWGRKWKTAAMFSSEANFSPASRKSRSPFFLGMVASWASTNTRNSVKQALGSGRSSWARGAGMAMLSGKARQRRMNKCGFFQPQIEIVRVTRGSA